MTQKSSIPKIYGCTASAFLTPSPRYWGLSLKRIKRAPDPSFLLDIGPIAFMIIFSARALI